MTGIMQMLVGGRGGTPAGQQAYTTAGTYTWVCPAGVTSVSVVCVGGGSSRLSGTSGGGFGGGLGYKNNISVTPGASYTVVVGNGTNRGADQTGGTSYFINTSTVRGGGATIAAGGTFTGDGGGNGGSGGNGNWAGGGGAGGYSGNGGNGGNNPGSSGTSGSGGGGGGGGGGNQVAWVECCNVFYDGGDGGGGGGVGLLGQGNSGIGGGTQSTPGGSGYGFGGEGGSGGNTAQSGYLAAFCGSVLNSRGGNGGLYGGGGGASRNESGGGANGAVRIIWAGGTGITRAFPSTNTGNL